MRVWFIVICLLLIGCQKAAYENIPADGTILAFGDSLTYGYNVDTAQSYPAVLARLSGRKVINAGVSGETTVDGLGRFKKLLDERHYDFVIIFEGGNDILRNSSAAQTKANLAKMINLARQKNIPSLLIAVPEKSIFVRDAPFYKELADAHGVPLMQAVVGDLLTQPQYKSDRVHFNQAGYEKLAKAIYAKMKRLGAL